MPIDGSKVLVEGAVGGDVTLEDAYHAARLTGLSILASLKRVLGDLDRVTRWLRAVGYVHAAPGFHDNAKGRERLQRPDRGDLGRRWATRPLGTGARPFAAQRADHRRRVRGGFGIGR